MTTSNTAAEPIQNSAASEEGPVPAMSGTSGTSGTSEDYVRVAAFATPAEAHVLHGILLSAGLTPVVTDSNTGQGNPWVSQSFHAVGVLVPASQVTAAREAQAAFESGAYALEDDASPAPAAAAVQPALLFNPDRAALLSFLLSPVFGAWVLMANARALGARSGGFSRWFWLLLAGAATGFCVLMLHVIAPGWLVGFRANLFVLASLTAIWYFASAQAQSRQIIAAYGPQYRRRSLLIPAVMTALGWVVLGLILSQWVI